MRLELVEGVFYQYPPEEVLVADHSTMSEVWRKCASLITDGVVMAPLLVDDRHHQSELCEQSVEDLLCKTTRRTYGSFPWFGPAVSEAQLEVNFSTSSCVELYTEYRVEVIRQLSLLGADWVWTNIHPVIFQNVGAEVLERLWKRTTSAINLNVVAGSLQTTRERFKREARTEFLNRFRSYWVEDGRVISHTRPTWQNGKVVHESVSPR